MSLAVILISVPLVLIARSYQEEKTGPCTKGGVSHISISRPPRAQSRKDDSATARIGTFSPVCLRQPISAVCGAHRRSGLSSFPPEARCQRWKRGSTQKHSGNFPRHEKKKHSAWNCIHLGSPGASGLDSRNTPTPHTHPTQKLSQVRSHCCKTVLRKTTVTTPRA